MGGPRTLGRDRPIKLPRVRVFLDHERQSRNLLRRLPVGGPVARGWNRGCGLWAMKGKGWETYYTKVGELETGELIVIWYSTKDFGSVIFACDKSKGAPQTGQDGVKMGMKV